MRDFEVILLSFLLVIVLLAFGFPRHYEKDNVILALEDAIASSVKTGDYRCCIDPPCKMCYLGDWIFEKGECACDDMIAEGKFDKVCPECEHGIEQGECESSSDSCTFDI